VRLRQAARVLLQVDDTPSRVALAFGIGLFIAFFPLLGVHTAMALAIAFGFRLSRVAILAGAWMNNPWTIAPMYAAGTLLGCAMLGVSPEGLAEVDWTPDGNGLRELFLHALRPYILPFVVGNLAAGVVCGVAGYFALKTILERRLSGLRAGTAPP
jgi:uncharacterized protein